MLIHVPFFSVGKTLHKQIPHLKVRQNSHLSAMSLKPPEAFLDEASEKLGAGQEVLEDEPVDFLQELLEEGAEKTVMVLSDLGGG